MDWDTGRARFERGRRAEEIRKEGQSAAFLIEKGGETIENEKLASECAPMGQT